MDASVWTGFNNTIIGSAKNQAFRDWWSGYRSTFGDRFRKHMDDIIAATSVRSDPGMVGVSCDSPVGGSQAEAGAQ